MFSLHPRFHPRLWIGVALGLAAWALAARLGATRMSGILVAWNVGAIIYLAAMWRLFLTASEADVQSFAEGYDEPPLVIASLAGVAIIASLVGVYAALTSSHGQSLAARSLTPPLAGLTLISTWFVVQSLFVAHYAHRHFQALAAKGPSAGFLFPGDPPRGYLDFAYLAICVGATAQVSDPGVQSRPLRNLVTAHAVTSFFYNTAVLALGVNILSGLIGH
jgi:uncharacterized membrane protein